MMAKKKKVKIENFELHDSLEKMDAEENESQCISLTGLKNKSSNKKKKSGGFQSMGLSFNVVKGILKKGYKVPTPIQRKTIPVVMEGKDVVAMARTGSGKTAAFLLPMYEKLKARSAISGARALIFSPTRELALQTLKFIKELGRFTGLRAAVVLGGDKIEDQFSAIHENPDIIIATPGRFLHLVMEMDLKLTSVEYLVFDEADRLFEMGFQEQLNEILHRLPEHRQTLLFSATLPRILVDFAKAGLHDPVLIRLDVESQLSEHLKTAYFCCNSDDKPAVLLHLLKNVVKPRELTVVFTATRHHVEYLKDILAKANISCTYVYSSLDQIARKLNVSRFRSHKVDVLLVTDVAARGIDIPFLDNVINYNFPAKPKLFVHRVGRVARAGRSGSAYSIVSPDEAAYVLDLHLFLSRPIKFAGSNETDTDGVYGSVPQNMIDDEGDLLTRWHENSVDLKNMNKVCSNAYKQYVKSRPAPSTESIKRMKEILNKSPASHPIFRSGSHLEKENTRFLEMMKSYRPKTTIFEIGATAKNQASMVMRSTKKFHKKMIDKYQSSKNSRECELLKVDQLDLSNDSKSHDQNEKSKLPAADEILIQSTFVTIKEKQSPPRKKKKSNFKDENHYLSYTSSDHHSEKGLELDKNFASEAAGAVLDLTADEDNGIKQQKNSLKWDRKKKKFLRESDNKKVKKIKTESGVWIPASYKSNLYKQWKEQSKIEHNQSTQDSDEDGDNQFGQVRPGKIGDRDNHFGQVRPGMKRDWDNQFGKVRPGMKGDRDNQFGKVRPGMKDKLRQKMQNRKRKFNGRPMKRELKTKEEILKTRQRKARLNSHQKKRHTERSRKRGKQSHFRKK